MKRRDGTHTPSPRALAYPVGAHTIHLLALPGSLTEITRQRLMDVGKEDPAYKSLAASRFLALCAFAAWDDAVFEWEVQAKPDDVLWLKGDDLVQVADACARELLGRSIDAMGLDAENILKAAIRAREGLAGFSDEDTAPGEAAPSEA